MTAFGTARLYGSLQSLAAGDSAAGLASTSSGHGYWLVTASGQVSCFGDAKFRGDARRLPLHGPIVAIAGDPAVAGYWLLGRDGGVFGYGAPYRGSGAPVGPPNVFYSMSVATGGTGYLLTGEVPA